MYFDQFSLHIYFHTERLNPSYANSGEQLDSLVIIQFLVFHHLGYIQVEKSVTSMRRMVSAFVVAIKSAFLAMRPIWPLRL